MVAQQQNTTNQADQPQGVMVRSASGGMRADVFWTKDSKTGALSKVEIDPEAYGQAPRQNFVRLRWKGVSDIFDMDGEFGKSKCVNLLWQINSPGAADHKKIFRDMAAVQKWGIKTESFYWNIGDNSKMGRIIYAITGQSVELNAGFNLCDYLNGEVQAMIKTTQKTDKTGQTRTTSSAAYDTIVAVEEAGPAGPNQYAPAPEPVTAAVNPFLQDDL